MVGWYRVGMATKLGHRVGVTTRLRAEPVSKGDGSERGRHGCEQTRQPLLARDRACR